MVEKITFNEALQRLFNSFLFENINTALPGIVQKQIDDYRIEVIPAVSKSFIDGTELKYKPIANVPIVYLRSAVACFRLPKLKAGDSVLLIFSQKALDLWLNNKENKQTKSSDPRRFDITDAIAIPGLFPFSINTPKAKNIDDLEIIHNDSFISIKVNGDIELNGGNKVIIKKSGDIEIGNASLKKLVTSAFKDVFNNHVHNFVAAPSGTFATTTPASVIATSLPPPPLPGTLPATFGSAITDNELTSKVKAQ